MEEYLKITKFAKMANVSASSVYLAIKRGSIKLTKVGNRSFINVKFLDFYKNGKISREYTCVNGNRLWDKDNGKLSIRMTCDLLNLKYNKIYFLIRTGRLRSTKIGSSWIIDLKDVMEYFHVDEAGNKKIV